LKIPNHPTDWRAKGQNEGNAQLAERKRSVRIEQEEAVPAMRKYVGWNSSGCAGAWVALLCLAAAAAAQTPSSWKEYSYPPDGFAVSFPTLPLVQTKNVPTDAGSIELHEYSEQVNGVSMVVTVSNYGAAMTGKDADAQLEGAKNGALKNAEAKLKTEKKITLDANHGLELEADNGSIHFTVRMVVAGTALYQIVVAAPVEKPFKGTTEFLDSFKLIEKPATTAKN
jgi:hypothetical protein